MIASDAWYVDSSALVRVYVPDQFSEPLNELLWRGDNLFLSDLCVTEVASSLCRLCREGVLTSEGARVIHSKLLADIARGVFQRVSLTTEVYRSTEGRMLGAVSVEGGVLRASGALHLGLAIYGGCRAMITFDRRLAEASLRGGLDVYPAPGNAA